MDTTKNYGLKQWDGSDRILRSDFNENNLSIEAALDAKQKNIDALDNRLAASIDALDNRLTASIANLSQTVAQHHSSRVRIIMGGYAGNGQEETHHIEIGEEVSLIFIWRTDTSLIGYPGTFTILPVKDIVTHTNYTYNRIKHTGSGFDIDAPEYNAASTSGEANYAYLAFVLDT